MTDRRLLATLRPYSGLFLFALAASTLAALFDGVTIVLLIPFLKLMFGTAGTLGGGGTRLEGVIETVLQPFLAGKSTGAAAGTLMVILMTALILKALFSYTHAQANVRIQESVVRDLRRQLFDRLLIVDLGFFQQTRVGQLLAVILADADQVKTAVSAALASLLQNSAIILTTLVILLSLSLRLTLITVATAPLLLIGVQLLVRRLRRHSAQRAEERGHMTAIATERLSAMKLIRASDTAAAESKQFGDLADRYRKRVIRTQRYATLTSPVTEIFAGLVLVLVIWAATVPAIVGTPMSPEAIIAFLLAALKVMSPLKSLTQFPTQWAQAAAGADRVYRVLDLPATEVDRPGEGVARFERDIVFDRVSFRYEAHGDTVLDEVSFEVPKGQVVALVGPSGGGKTTLVELLPRFWEPTSGQILLDGVPLSSLTRGSVRSLMAVVGQDTILLNDTVHANIAYGMPQATREQVEHAAQAANAAEFVTRLPERYDTMLGERGARLSGGQRQRIAIARALLRDAPILILDEATSALDTESERLVQQAIDRLMRDRTVLVIAHRLATVRHADQILVLDGGRIVERGTHDALLASGGLYRRLHDLQFLGLAEATLT
ncbi:MAG TPA: ABC transporter transmembrane domain-containing protein [Gemmatimonadales bacterium]|nr:ABC transporter transmembrane domain-containing protein [Gemmatimonadales bacterium]